MDGVGGGGLRLTDPETGVFSLSCFTVFYLIPRKTHRFYLSISENSDCQAEYGGAFITVSPEFRKLR